MESIWSKSTKIEPRHVLPGNIETQAAVIGGGMAGVLTAYFLQKQGVKTVLLEADALGGGQTKNTTAKITAQHGLIYAKLIDEIGEEKARQYALANSRALEDYRSIIEENGIVCGMENCPAYLYAMLDDLPLRQEADSARRLGLDASFTTETGLPFQTAGAVRFDWQARFNPLKFLKAVAEKITVYEHTRVKILEGDHTLVTDQGTVHAEKIIFACHFPFVNFPGYYFLRMHQERSYVLALENAPSLPGVYLGTDAAELSLRNAEKNLLLFGGGGHRTGENRAGGQYAMLRAEAERLFPGSKEVAHWSAQDCMPLDGVPYIGQFSAATPDWFVATGFGKWGMSSSMAAARILSDAVIGKENDCASVFSPQRFTPTAGAKQLLDEAGHAVRGLSRQPFAPARAQLIDLPVGHGGVVEQDGEKLGVYKDENGVVFTVSTRCPHLGCQLEWNPDEKSWDCPCHGSRFDYKGNLISGPAQEELAHG